MKNKKIWARIGAIFACVLLVGAFAIPCFADETQPATTAVEPPEPPPDGYVPPYGTAIDEFMATLDPRANNGAFATLLSIYNGYGDTRFFDIKALFSSTMDTRYNESYTVYIPIDYNLYFGSPSTYTQSFSMNVDNIAVVTYEAESSVPTETFWYTSGRFDITLYFDDDSCMMDINYTVVGSPVPTFGLRFSGTYSNDQLELHFNNLSIGGDTYFPSEFYKLDFAFGVSQYSEVHLLPYIGSLFNSSYAPLWYWEQVYSPYEFYQGFKKSYNLGYADAEMWAYQYGYEDGKLAGIEIGKQQTVENSTAYQQGYDDAVKDIDSGDFGRNFLGAGFSAPFKALQEFTLIEWTTENGTTFSVTMALLFSAIVGVCLFVWFLKMFAGG